ncbi:MAG: excinuclease ABC subunit UvrC [bacterium]|nr:excinuclease ABC subunit UvrC [bacterium]MDZ4231386.1 excinuclease ABC subunit UvrC [Patescibacteria group bacterium]
MKDLRLDKIPETPGVYLFKGARGKLLYVGKAGNLKRRVSSYFAKSHSDKTQKLVQEIREVEYIGTPTAIEALILEADLIKKHEPPYNFKEKDDKSFLYVEITKEAYPRVLLVRGRDRAEGERFGPFTNASDIRTALRILRKIFPYSTHEASKIGKAKRPCFNAQIGLCPGVCTGGISKSEYRRNIRNLKLFLRGNKDRIVKELEKDMKLAAKGLDFEEAARLKRQLFALHHIQDIALVSKSRIIGEEKGTRIEGYDISNINGANPVGAMVVFIDGQPAVQEYRKFKIRTIDQSDDVGMLKEVLSRRFSHTPPAGGWPLPEVVLVDGGKGQVNAAEVVIGEAGLRIPVVGIAKGPTRKKNEFVGKVPKGFMEETLIQIRDEAHRFAIKYHKEVRGKSFIGK